MLGKSKHVKIDHVEVKGHHHEDKEKLKHNYFQLVSGTDDEYEFYTPETKPIATNPPRLKEGEDFSFYLKTLPDVVWTVTDFKITHDDASGKWTNSRHPDDDEGSFQAQASGGGGVEEGASSATA